MKKSFLLIISIVVVIALIGSSLGYVYMHNNSNTSNNNTNTKGTKSNPTLKILNFTSSLNPIESPEHYYVLPWNNSSPNFYIPFFNVSIYSQSSASIRIYMKSPNGTIMNLLSEPVIKYENITCPSGISTSMLEYSFMKTPGNYTITSELFQNSTIVYDNLTEIVRPEVEAGSISGLSGNVTLNTTLHYNANGAKYGISPYKYYWYIQYEGNEFALIKSKENISFVPNETGNYNISLYVVDKFGYISFTYLYISVSSFPVATIVPEYSQVDQGIIDSFSADINGGFQPFTYSWKIYHLGAVVFQGTEENISYNFTDVGIYRIILNSTDQLENNFSAEYNLTVNPVPVFNVSLQYMAIDSGMSDNLYVYANDGTFYMNLTVIGGKIFFGEYYFIEYIDGKVFGNPYPYTPVSSGNNSYTPGLPSGVGNYSVTFMVYDPFYYENFTFNLTINKDLNSHIMMNPSANLSVGENVTLQAVYSGGTGPYNFTWSISWFNGSVTLYGQKINFIIPAGSNYGEDYSVQLTINDLYGGSFYGGESIDYYDFWVY